MVSVWDRMAERRIGTAVLMKPGSTATAITIEDRVESIFSCFDPNVPLIIEAYTCKF